MRTKAEVFQMIKEAKEVYVEVIINENQLVSFKVSKKEAMEVIKYQVLDDDKVTAHMTFGNLYIG